ncbi:hypothetical protein SSX86_007940 [Deinandra increscens subsp. villosa]|uniref:Serine hydrolase domain-containing protein n=1 Tax=Deinandra increscens subsp. villosa TaxID=3103831 RepID=A0AAP0DED8_9ASTR
MRGWFNWVRLLLLFFAAQPEDMETPKKPRILCLHGHGSNAAIHKRELDRWPDYVLDKMDLVFINGPFSIDDGISDYEQYTWFTCDKEKKIYLNFDESIAYIEARMIEFGPIDGVLGFSEGALVTASLPGIQEQGLGLTKVQKIKHVIIISGGKFGGNTFPCPELAETAFSSPINIPSLHIFGENDYARKYAPELVEAYVDPLVMLHNGVHEVPKLDEEGVIIMFEFLKKIDAIV